MQKLVIAFSCLALFACHAPDKKETPGGQKKEPASDSLPFTASYSSRFESGDAVHLASVLKVWKAFDEGQLTSTRTLFADTINLYMADGSKLSGRADSVLHSVQLFRDGFASVQSTTHAWVALRSVDKQENWVNVWGSEISVDKAGKKDSTYLMESWRLNAEGKIDLLYQFNRKYPANR